MTRSSEQADESASPDSGVERWLADLASASWLIVAFLVMVGVVLLGVYLMTHVLDRERFEGSGSVRVTATLSHSPQSVNDAG